MAEAIKEAEKAGKKGDIPIGAVIVKDNRVISRGHNGKELKNDPCAHAEIIAIKKASKALLSWRLKHTTLYVTLEPCIMCMGAIMQARVKRLVFACHDPKAGACGSLYDMSRDLRLNHRLIADFGVLGKEASAMLKEFFLTLRGSGGVKSLPPV